MPDLLERPYEDHKRALERAKAAGDDQAASEIRGVLKENYPEYHRNAMSRAREAGDEVAAEQIAHEYWGTRGEFGSDELAQDPVFQEYSKQVYRTAEGEEFEGEDEDAGSYGVSLMRGLDSSDWTLLKQGARWASGDISEEERRALRVLSSGYANSESSMEGFLEHGKNVLFSPSTWAGLGVGSIATKGATKAAAKPLIKQMLKKAATEEGKDAAKDMGQELAERGVRTKGQRFRRGTATGAAEGAAFSAAHNAGQQSFQNEDGEYNIGEGLASAGGGALVGGAIGGVVGPLLGRDGKAIREGKKMVEGLDSAPGGAGQRIMQQVIEDHGTGDLITRANKGDVVGAYKDLINNGVKLDAEQLLPTFQHAGDKALRQTKTLFDETVNIGKQFGIGDKVRREAMDAIKAAKKDGVDPQTIGVDLIDHPNYSKLKPEVRKRLEENINQMQEAAMQASRIADFANKTFGEQGAVEKILSMPEVNVALDQFPRGYVVSRALGRSLGAIRGRTVPKRFHRAMDNVADLDPKKAPGEATRARIDTAIRKRGDVADVERQADEASINLDTNKWKNLAKRTQKRSAKFGKLKEEAAERRDVLRAKRDLGQIGGSTKHGGVQAEMAIRRRMAAPDVVRELNRMQDETYAAAQDLAQEIRDAKAQGLSDDLIRELQDELKSTKQYRKY